MSRSASLFALISLLAVGCSTGPRIYTGPLVAAKADPIPALYPDASKGVKITVEDRRGPDPLLAAGIVGPKGTSGKGIYIGYKGQKPDELPRLLESEANDAARALGFGQGDDLGLDVVIDDFRVAMYRFSGYSPMNCIGFGKISTTLRAPNGSTDTKQHSVAYFDHTLPVMSMKEVTKEAISRIYSQAIAEAVTAALRPQMKVAPDKARLRDIVQRIEKSPEDADLLRKQLLFTLGLSESQDPDVKRVVLASFRSGVDQRTRQAAAEAIGLLKITEARPEIESLLAGRTKIGEWDTTDVQDSFHLLRALGRLGVTDLDAHIPNVEPDVKPLLVQLAAFMEKGEMPVPREEEQRMAEQARLAFKR